MEELRRKGHMSSLWNETKHRCRGESGHRPRNLKMTPTILLEFYSNTGVVLVGGTVAFPSKSFL
jgi:hypothetical protein